MVKFISENWANILLIIVGSFALATYILQERKKKIDAASLIVLQIDEFQERLEGDARECFIRGGGVLVVMIWAKPVSFSHLSQA